MEGTLIIKSILKRKPVSTLALVECELNVIQLKNVIESLQEMDCTSVSSLLQLKSFAVNVGIPARNLQKNEQN